MRYFVPALLLIRFAAAQRAVFTWSFQQARGTSPWAGWLFVPAGNFSIPQDWGSPVVTWSFDGAYDAWYTDQTSLGAVCFRAAPPSSTGSTVIRTSQSCSAAPGVDYSVGFWLWSTASVFSGSWTVTVEYSPYFPPPPLPRPPAPPPIPAAWWESPVIPGTNTSAPQAWSPTLHPTGAACSKNLCTLPAGVTSDALLVSALPASFSSTSDTALSGGAYYAGIFFYQSQNFTCAGYPAVLQAVSGGSNGSLPLWVQDLPNTPSGESCQGSGGECPSCGLTMPLRMHSAVTLLPSAAVAMRAGFSPTKFNSWEAGQSSGAVSFSASPMIVLRRLPTPSPPGWLGPGAWTASWTDWLKAHASGEGSAATLAVRGCSAAVAEANFGWVDAGTFTIRARAVWSTSTASALSVRFTSNGLNVSISQMITVTATGSADSLTATELVPAGPLSVAFQLSRSDSSCANASDTYILLTDIYGSLAPLPAPAGAFVVQASHTECLQGMQPFPA